MKAVKRFALLLFVASTTALAQKPAVSPGGAVSAATFASASGPGHALVPGGIASLFGENLAAAPLQAGALPLPTKLGGTTVTVNGIAAPLFYVSPSQINFQVPASIAVPSYGAYSQASIIVTTPAGSSAAATADVYVYNPGIFTQNASGCGSGAVLNVNPDGSTSLNSPSNSVAPGDFLSIFATGLGVVAGQPPDGEAAPSVPLARYQYGTQAQFYWPASLPDEAGAQSMASWAGKAPGLVGVDQVNVQVPVGVPQGCAVPFRFATQDGLSQSITVSIHNGGGQCVDPPMGSAGTILLKKSVVLNDDTIPESDTVAASFTQWPGMTVPPRVVLPLGLETETTVGQAPSCTAPGYSTLNAGEIELSGPAGQAQVQPSVTAGQVSYLGSLPSGFVQAGTFGIFSAGGESVGIMRATLNLGSDIQIRSQFPKGSQVDGLSTITVNWTGGQAGEVATLSIVEHQFLYDFVVTAQFPVTGGYAWIYPSYNTGTDYPIVAIIQESQDIEIVLDIGTDPAQPQTISASGLTLGAQVGWVYEYRFTGLSWK
jgi:uncharacterized protein (TIGR03437 family)